MILFVRASIRYNYQIHPYIIKTMLLNPYCDKNYDKNDSVDKSEIVDPPTNCCMSGCANCVWIEYANKLTKIFQDGGESARKEIMDKVEDSNMRAFLEMELRNMNLENQKK